MRTKLLFVFGAAAAAALVIAALAGAHGVPTTCPRIGMIVDPNQPNPLVATFPADTPFHVRHGFVCPVLPGPVPLACPDPTGDIVNPRLESAEPDSAFERVPAILSLDIDRDESGICPGDRYCRTFVSNFHHGLPAGTYIFRAEWLDDAKEGTLSATSWPNPRLVQLTLTP